MLKLFLFTLIILISFPLYTQERIIDNASLLSSSEKTSLTNLIDSLSRKYNFDLVIVTERNIGGKTPMAYADDFYDYNGYGLGANRDGCLFLQVTESRDYWFSTSGSGIKILNSAAFNKTEKDAVKFLKAGNNYEAYRSFLSNWEIFLKLDSQSRNYNFFYQWNFVLVLIAWLISFGIGCIVVQSWKSGMNTALAKTQAAAYIIPGSLALKVKEDKFLYSTVSQTKKQNDDNLSAGRGGGSHTSSSGRSHGGGGGKY